MRIPVSVTYDPQTQTLSATPETVVLNDSTDWVHWQIAEDNLIPAGASLAILFDPPLGPFQTVRSFDSLNLAAKGNSGVVDSFSYSLYLIPSNPLDENLATGGPFTVDNQSEESNASPWLTVTFTPPDHVQIDPPHLLLFDGDVAFWKVVGLPEDHVVAFRFVEQPHFPGPFPTYFSTRPGGSGEGRLGVANFGAVTGQRNYSVKIWDRDGHLVALTEDPSVDGLGNPPGT